MSRIQTDFKQYIDDRVANLDFEAAYHRIKNDNLYDPVFLEDALFLTFQRVVLSLSQQEKEKIPALQNYILMVKDSEYVPNKTQLLTIIVEMAVINENISAHPNDSPNIRRYDFYA